MIKQSLPLRVLVISFIALALPLLVDSFIFFQKNYNESIRDAENELEENASYRAIAISMLEPVKQVMLKELDVLMQLEEETKTLPNLSLNQQLRLIVKLNHDFKVYILDGGKKGVFTVLYSGQPGDEGKKFTSYSQLPEVASKGEGDYLRYIYFEQEKRSIPYLFVARKIANDKILMVGNDIEKLIQPIVEEGEKREYAILNQDGIVFSATNPVLLGEVFSPISPLRRGQILNSGQLGSLTISENPLPQIKKENSRFFEFIFQDKVQIAYRTPIPEVGLAFLAYSPKEEIFGKSIRHFLLIYSVYGFVLIVGGGITYWLALYISKPLKQLCFVMGKVSEEEYNVRFKPEPLGFEINILGEIFNQSLDSLLENIAHAEEEHVKRETAQRELELGQEVQSSLLPQKMPQISGIEIASIYLPAKQVGGDFYDLFVLEDGKLALSVADAAGQGISTCLYSLGVRSLLRTHMTIYDDVKNVLGATNKLFYRDAVGADIFVTVLMSLYDPQTKELTYFSCGHVPPLLCKADGQLIKLERRGPAMGLIEDQEYQPETVQLGAGDLVLFYTNGLTDVVDEKLVRFSEKRLLDALQKKTWKTAEEVVQGLAKTVDDFVKGQEQEEEVVILALRVL